MGKVTFEKGSPYFNMFGEYYTITKAFINGDVNGERPDAYWEAVISKMDQFYKKYPCDFARALAMALVDELERRGKLEEAEKKAILS